MLIIYSIVKRHTKVTSKTGDERVSKNDSKRLLNLSIIVFAVGFVYTRPKAALVYDVADVIRHTLSHDVWCMRKILNNLRKWVDLWRIAFFDVDLRVEFDVTFFSVTFATWIMLYNISISIQVTKQPILGELRLIVNFFFINCRIVYQCWGKIGWVNISSILQQRRVPSITRRWLIIR